MRASPAVPTLFPFGRLLLACAALIALAGFQLRKASHHGRYRLELHITADDDRDCVYGSQWYAGAPEVEEIGVPTALHTQYEYYGCTWEGVETLIPDGSGSYRYEYREHVVSCAPDAEETFACVRSGVVTPVSIE
jgi:hypothetical protein